MNDVIPVTNEIAFIVNDATDMAPTIHATTWIWVTKDMSFAKDMIMMVHTTFPGVLVYLWAH